MGRWWRRKKRKTPRKSKKRNSFCNQSRRCVQHMCTCICIASVVAVLKFSPCSCGFASSAAPKTASKSNPRRSFHSVLSACSFPVLFSVLCYQIPNKASRDYVIEPAKDEKKVSSTPWPLIRLALLFFALSIVHNCWSVLACQFAKFQIVWFVETTVLKQFVGSGRGEGWR